jgi:hypothetical protein
VAGGQSGGEILERRPQPALEPISLDGASELAGDREAKPWGTLGVVVARERVEDQEPGRDRPALPVDGVEVAGAGETMLASAHAERRLRPFARRRLRIERPARVDIRARNPCRRFRRRTFG